MWLLFILGGVGYAIWQASQSGVDPSALLQSIEDEGSALATAAGNEVDSVVTASEDDVSALVGSPTLTSASTILNAATPYAAIIESAATASGWDENLLVGIGWQESNLGTSSQLDMQGPGGTGDFTARSITWMQNAIKADPNLANYLMTVTTLPPGWHGTGAGPWCIPSDGRGFGRGVWQIDLPNAYQSQWDDPTTNLNLATANLTHAESVLKSRAPNASQDALIMATVAAYNEGEVSALTSALQSGSDPSTTYSNRVLGFANKVSSAGGLSGVVGNV